MTTRTKTTQPRQTLERFRLARYAADERAASERALMALRDRVAREAAVARNLYSRYIRAVAP